MVVNRHIFIFGSALVAMLGTAWGSQTLRPLPPTPQQNSPSTKENEPSQSIQLMKEATQFMINEFKDACGSHISNLKSIRPDPQKPNGYGTQMMYYTPQDKIGLMTQLNKLIGDKSTEANKFLSDLETKEKNQGTVSVQEIMGAYIKISGTLNEGRKNCAFSLTQMEKQELKTNTLKQCASTPQTQSSTKAEPKKQSMLKVLPKALQRSDNSSQKGKKASPEERDRILQEALQKSGM